jgi:hypothetical protein
VASHPSGDPVLASCVLFEFASHVGFELSAPLSERQLVTEPEEELMVEGVRLEFREEDAEMLRNTDADRQDA